MCDLRVEGTEDKKRYTDMEVNAVSAQNLAAVAGSLTNVSVMADPTPAAVLGGSNVNVTSASPDLEAILSLLRMETNEARLNAARSRISSALNQLSGLSEAQMEKVDEMKASGNELIDAENVYNANSEDYSSSLTKLETAKTNLNKANVALEKAEEKVSSAQLAYDSAVAELEAYRDSALELDQSKLDMLEKAVTDAQERLAAAKNSLLSAKSAVDSVQAEYDSAVAASEAAKVKYDKAKATLNEKQDKFDSLVSSLDAASLTALRDALKLFADDVDHLHDEIEKDDEKHDLAPIRSVEDVISDSLKRLDGEIVDELQDRHLDHV
jgi:chromosome segregation ATPase